MSSFVFGDGFCHVGNYIAHFLYSYPICHHTTILVDMFNVAAVAQQPLVEAFSVAISSMEFHVISFLMFDCSKSNSYCNLIAVFQFQQVVF